MSDSASPRMQRLHRPRVQITYETGASGGKKELPFVVGVVGDFSGNAAAGVPKLRDRKFVQIDREKFNGVMQSMAPGLELKVRNSLAGDDSQFLVRLSFRRLEDFAPAAVAAQVEPLRRLLEAREKLRDLLTRLDRDQAFADRIWPAVAVPRPSGELPADANPAAAVSPLDSALVATSATAAPEDSGRLELFLKAGSAREQLACWLASDPSHDRPAVLRRLNCDVALIDQLINEQLNALLHHPAFQQLEASWRGISYLVDQVDKEGERRIKIRLLNLSWRELGTDLERAVEFDQSQFFRKVYEEEFGHPGGEPYGVLLGDYQIQPRSSREHPDDLGMLKSLSQVAAAAFCPFVTSVSPAMFGVDDFSELQHQLQHAKTLNSPEYFKWNALRKTEDARFVGLTLPRVLMRLPYGDADPRVERFCFREDVSGPDHSGHLWGNAVYAFGGVLIRAFAETAWFADIQGLQRGVDGGGLVSGLPADSFRTDKRGVALKAVTDVVVTDRLERELSELGFLPLCSLQDSEFAAFFRCPSIQLPALYDRAAATANARLSAMLSHILCVSRFAHYLKILGRDQTGEFTEAEGLQDYLQRWIGNYVTPDKDPSPERKAKYPLYAARVEVRAQPGKPGAFQCVMHLEPHFELEELAASVRLATELARPRGA